MTAWLDLGWQAWLTLGTMTALLAALVTDRVPADVATLGALGLLMVCGVLDVKSGLAGFANEGVATVGVLYIVAAGLEASGVMAVLSQRVLGSSTSLRITMLRLLVPVAGLSAFLNNTPLVAMMVPVTKEAAAQQGHAKSKLLMPLSFAAILGGTCTLIGTTTNLVVDGLLVGTGHPGLGFFDIAWVGVPLALTGLVFLVVFGPMLLPDDRDAHAFPAPEELTAEFIVDDSSRLVGRRLGDLKLGGPRRILPIAVVRGGAQLPAPSPELLLAADDRLVFVGSAATILAVRREAGLITASNRAFDFTARRGAWGGHIVEVVLSDRSPLLGAVVGDGKFRAHYGAAVLAIGRKGRPIDAENPEDWRLRVGDSLLLEASETFRQHIKSRDFFVIAEHESPAANGGGRRLLAIGVAVAMVAAASLGVVPIFIAAAVAAALMLGLRLVSPQDARDSLDVSVLLTIAASFGIALALESTGVAGAIASTITGIGGPAWITLAVVYLVTSVLTAVVTNNAAAALVFPFAHVLATSLGHSPVPYAVAIMFAASASFATPLGYQTNLMVYGAGGYRFSDFLRLGLPMNVVAFVVTVPLIARFFPF